MNEQIEKLEHGLMICEATGTKLVHIEKADAEKILGLLKEQESVIEALKSDLDETLAVLGEKPEIVRCAGCKYCVKEPNGELYCDILAVGHEPLGSKKVNEDWFCADGERKD